MEPEILPSPYAPSGSPCCCSEDCNLKSSKGPKQPDDFHGEPVGGDARLLEMVTVQKEEASYCLIKSARKDLRGRVCLCNSE